jgi:hypothetical protein
MEIVGGDALMKSGSVTEVLTTTTKSEQDDIFRQQRVSVCTWCISPARYMASMFGAGVIGEPEKLILQAAQAENKAN